jgi:hypothetical protein
MSALPAAAATAFSPARQPVSSISVVRQQEEPAVMEGLNRLVAESLARHGFDRPVDYRRLHWSRWFRCESPHSLLFVPSKPGVFALAEEIMEVGTAAEVWGRVSDPAGPSKARLDFAGSTTADSPAEGTLGGGILGGAALQRCDSSPLMSAASAAEVEPVRRMLAVLQFCEDDDMAFVLDRMFSRENPMRARLASGRCFVRFVAIEDAAQRRGICAALNQWLISSGEKASGIGAHFATSLELTPATDDMASENVTSMGRAFLSSKTARVGAGDPPAHAGTTAQPLHATPPAPDSEFKTAAPASPPQLDSGAVKNLHCPHPLPSGF